MPPNDSPQNPLFTMPLSRIRELTESDLFDENLDYSEAVLIRARSDLVPCAIASLTQPGTTKVESSLFFTVTPSHG